MPSDWLYRCPACGFTDEKWDVCKDHMSSCCSHLLLTQKGKSRKAKEFRVPNENRKARMKNKAEKRAARLTEEKARAASVIDPSRPFMCPALGCTERYGTRERCERHIQVCASAIAHVGGDRKKLQQLEPFRVGDGDGTVNENGESSKTKTTCTDHNACVEGVSGAQSSLHGSEAESNGRGQTTT